MHRRGRYSRSTLHYSRTAPNRYKYCKKERPTINPNNIDRIVERGFFRKPSRFSYTSRSNTASNNSQFHYIKSQINPSVSPLVDQLSSPPNKYSFPNKNYTIVRTKIPRPDVNLPVLSKRCIGRYSIGSVRHSVRRTQIRSRFKICHNAIGKKLYVGYTLPRYSVPKSKYIFRRMRQEDPLQGKKQQAAKFSYTNPYRLRVKRAIETLRYKRKPVCMYFVRTGACPNTTECRFQHDINYLRICPRFLSRTCPLGEEKCKLAHVLDPCRIPQCEYFAKGGCSRESCPYLHVQYSEAAVTCPRFMNGRCEYGRKCDKRHIWLAPTRAKSKVRQPQSTISLLSLLRKSSLRRKTEAKETRSQLICAPEGSLRDVFPAPSFIPFELEKL